MRGLALLLSGLFLAAAVGAPGVPKLEPGIAAWVLLALVLELGAPRVGPFGFFSLGGAAYLALALAPGGGPKLAAVAVAGILCVRTLAQGHAQTSVRLAELACDLLPASAGLAAAAWAPASSRPLVAAAVYTVVALATIPRMALALPRDQLLDWYPLNYALLPLRAASGAAGWALAATPPLAGLMLAPVFWGCQQLARNLSVRLQAQDSQVYQAQLARSKAALDRVNVTVTRTQQELETTQSERNLQEEFTRHLARSPDIGSTLDLILRTAAQVVPYRTVVIFLAENRELTPVRYATPDPARLEAATLLKTREPLVDECWGQRSVLQSTPHLRRGGRLFDETSAVALPLQNEGVLYVGREGEEPYSELELQRVSQVASLAALALQSSRRQLAREEALKLYEATNLRLQEWVDRLAVLLEGSRDFASSLDPDHLVELLEGQIVRTVAQDFGCILYTGPRGPASEVRQWTVNRLLPAEPEAGALRALADAVMENRRPLLLDDIGVSRLVPPAGRELVSWLCVPMLTEEGATGAILLGANTVGFFTREHQDLLLLLAFQAAVTLSNAYRFRAVVEARRQLEASQAQLVQSSKMAAVGQLAAGVAHEINSPLGAIMLALDAAESRLGKGNPEAVAPKLQRARKAAVRARQIIEKLLFYSRAPETEQALLEPVKLAEDTVEFLSHQLLMDGIEIYRELSPVPAIRANFNELQQVMVNLLMNARDALAELPPERRKIKVKTACEGERVMLSVQDLGPGIPQETLDRIFEPFFTTKEVGKGTGLGLSISLQIVEQQGGKIEVESTPGRGTTFTLVFPPG